MKRILVYLILLIVCGCSNPFHNMENKAKRSSSNCSEKPTAALDNQNIKSIVLNQGAIAESGMVNSSQTVGYAFVGQAGQQLNYQTNQDICVWVYTPERQLLNGLVLPKTGKYTIQVSAVKGSTTFDLEMSLGTITASHSQPTPLIAEQVYNVRTPPTLEHSQQLQAIVSELISLAVEQGMPRDALSITLIDVNSGKFAEYQQEQLRFPASVAKLFWMVVLYSELQKGILSNEQAFTGDLEKMLVRSDNEATSRIINQITDTTSGSELTGEELQAWLNKRYQLNSFFQEAGYGKIDISQKTFPIPNEKLYEPKGRDLQMRGDPQKPIRNKVTTQQAARLMHEIVKGQAVSPEYSKKMERWLTKDLNLEIWKHLDPNAGEFNPVRTFFGESLPKDVYFLSKAGWTSSTRQEVAFVKTRNGKTAYILAIFAEDRAYAQNGKIFPKMSRLVFDRMVARGALASAKRDSSPSFTTPQPSQQTLQFSPQLPNQSRSLGWLRLGVVKNNSDNATPGEPLIATTLPVSITSATVPNVGDLVTVGEAFNLRKSPPKPPNNELSDKIGGLKAGQQIVILKINSFPDFTAAHRSVVWAEVGSPE